MVERHETGLGRQHRSVNGHAVDRVGAVEDKNLFPVLGGRFNRQTQSRGVSVKAATHVLDVKDERVEVFQVLGLWLVQRPDQGLALRVGFPGFALGQLGIQTVDRQARVVVVSVGDLFVQHSANAMLRAKENFEFKLRRIVEQVNGGVALAIVAGVIGDQADPHSFERRELLLDQHVNAVKGL